MVRNFRPLVFFIRIAPNLASDSDSDIVSNIWIRIRRIFKLKSHSLYWESAWNLFFKEADKNTKLLLDISCVILFINFPKYVHRVPEKSILSWVIYLDWFGKKHPGSWLVTWNNFDFGFKFAEIFYFSCILLCLRISMVHSAHSQYSFHILLHILNLCTYRFIPYSANSQRKSTQIFTSFSIFGKVHIFNPCFLLYI